MISEPLRFWKFAFSLTKRTLVVSLKGSYSTSLISRVESAELDGSNVLERYDTISGGLGRYDTKNLEIGRFLGEFTRIF